MTSPQVDQDDRTKNIAKGIGSLSIQGILTSVLGFVLLTSLLRLLPYPSYSAYSSLQVTIAVAYTFGFFGLGYAVVRFLAPASSEGGGPGWAAAKASVALTVLLSGVVSVVLAAIAPLLSDYFMKGPSWSWVFYLGALWLFTSSVATVLLGVLQAVRRYQLMARLTLVSRFAGVGVAVAGLVLYGSLEVAILSWALYYGIISVAVFLFFRKELMAADSGPYYREVLKYATPLGASGIVVAVAANADIVVVGGYLNPASLGIYNATIIISSLVSALFVVPLTTALFAETSFSAEVTSKVSKGASLALRFTALTVLPASFLAAAMAPQLFGLFSGGGSYFQGIPYLQVISLFYIFLAVQSIAINVLQGVSRTQSVLIIGAVTAVGEVILSASLVPAIGLAGAAYSRVITLVAGSTISLYFIRHYFPRPIDFKFLSKALLASGIPALAIYLATTYVSGRVITLIPYTLLGAALFLACARTLTLFSVDDKSYISHLLPSSLKWLLRIL